MDSIGNDIFRDVLENLCEGVRIINPSGKVAFWNKGAEMITGFTSTEALGAPCRNSLHLQYNGTPADDICATVCPFGDDKTETIKLHPGPGLGPNEQKAYLRHKDGYLVPVLICVKPIHGPDGQLKGVVEMFHDMSWNMAALERIEELKKLSLVDALTGTGNRRFAEMTVGSRLEEFRRYGVSLGLIYVDVDKFKNINDKYGHKEGDRLLRVVAKSMEASLRSYDTICRLGGDEFIVISPNIGNTDNLNRLATRLCQSVSNSVLPMEAGAAVNVTASVGATLAVSGDGFESILERADSMMYRSKAAGRNRVTVG